MGKYKTFLIEEKLNTLYHFTKLSRFFAILRTDTLRVPGHPLGGGEGRAIYGVSFTRDPDYHKLPDTFITGNQVRLTIDKNKLSQVYEVEPFEAEGFTNEQEEIVKQDITSLHEYIVSVDVIDREEWLIWKTDILPLANKLNLKIDFI